MALAPSLSVVSGGRRRGGGGRRRTGSVSGDWIERRPEKKCNIFRFIFTNGPNKLEYGITQDWKGLPLKNTLAYCAYL
jgi:hypothetical protein